MNEALRQSVADHLTGILGIKVLLGLGTPDRPTRPNTPYAQLGTPVSISKVGLDENVSDPDVGGKASTRLIARRRSMVTLRAFGEAAADYIEEARLAVSRESNMRDAIANGFALLEVGTVIGSEPARDTGFEEQALAELTIGWVHEETTTQDGTIESADIEGEADSIDVDVVAP